MPFHRDFELRAAANGSLAPRQPTNLVALSPAQCEQMGIRLRPHGRNLMQDLAFGAKTIGHPGSCKANCGATATACARSSLLRFRNSLRHWLDHMIGNPQRLHSRRPRRLSPWLPIVGCKSCDWVEESADQNGAKRAGFATERQVIEIQGRCEPSRSGAQDIQSSKTARR